MAADKTNDKKDTLSLEENFDLLNEITSKLQSDDLPLEEAFDNYKKGIDLIKTCSEQIEMVEKEVLTLNSDMSVESLEQ